MNKYQQYHNQFLFSLLKFSIFFIVGDKILMQYEKNLGVVSFI